MILLCLYIAILSVHNERTRNFPYTLNMPTTPSKIESDCSYFVAFCPKYRRPVLVDGVEDRLRELIEQTCKENGITLDTLMIQPDRVFMTLRVEPKLGIHRAVKRIKADSSSALRKEFDWLKSRLPTLWTNSYHVQSYGKVNTGILDEYITQQKSV